MIVIVDEEGKRHLECLIDATLKSPTGGLAVLGNINLFASSIQMVTPEVIKVLMSKKDKKVKPKTK